MFGRTPPPTHVGPFEVLRELGRGGMGVVYVARDPITGREVAVKQVLAGGASGPAVERFVREAEALGRVKHKGVVGVHQLGRTQDGPYLVLELIAGEPLSARVAQGPLEPALAARLMRDVADAIAAVHAQGIIHRDLKPANVMVRADGSPVLLDFGLARDVNAERLTKTGDVLGTVIYMSPEQADGRTKDLDERVDVYGLGAVLFELLAGAPPHQGPGFEVIVKLLTKDPPRLRDRSPQVPAALDAVCALAMAREREQRYPSARALRDDLDRFLRGAPTEAAKRFEAAAPRGRRARAALAVGVLALGGTIGVVVARRGRDPAPAAVTTEASAAPVPSAPTGPPPLWRLAPDQRTLLYDLRLEERAPMQTIAFGARLRMNADAPAGGSVRFRCEVASLRCALHGGFEMGFDSEAEDPTTSTRELAPLGAAVEWPFECTIDAATGAVRLQGFGAISAAIRREAERTVGVSESLDVILKSVFTDAFIGRSMHALTCVRGDDAVVPWEEDDAGLFAGQAERGVVLGSPNGGPAPGPEQRYRVVGRSRYGEGRVVEASLTQDPLPADPRLSMTWSMTLLER